ncbi:MAG TPA: hypothetical protein VJ767_05865 [Nitrososphaeraceae archaeon]|nr:hypothetical protein [Nitrososphaeraceae archaeon]
MTTFTGQVRKIEVLDTSKTARVEIDTPSVTLPDTFKVANDDDSSYEAMVSILALARVVVGINVTIEHGGDKEINKLTF